ncbi:transposable element Tcb1 transposase [Trichonephila clavipes]|nr:transposable element Tcb1 transposase [Trichonephila clavipes]
MAVNDSTASYRQLAARWSAVTGVLMPSSLIRQPRSRSLPSSKIPGAIFPQDNARPHVAKTVRDFCSAQHMRLLPWPAYSPDISPIVHMRDLVGQRLARDPRPAASKYELVLRIQEIWSKQTFKICLIPYHVV